MNAYLDASALVPALVQEQYSAAIDAFRSQRHTLFVSEFAAAEVSAALSRIVRMGEIEANAAEQLLAHFDAWRAAEPEDVVIEASDLRRATRFVRRFNLMLRAPDALHAAVCQRLGLTLVTLDQRLARAAGALGIPVLNPAESSPQPPH